MVGFIILIRVKCCLSNIVAVEFSRKHNQLAEYLGSLLYHLSGALGVNNVDYMLDKPLILCPRTKIEYKILKAGES